jgi:hypothetical protein
MMNIRERLESLADRAVYAGMKYTDSVFMISKDVERAISEVSDIDVYGPVMSAKIHFEGVRKAFPLMYGFPIMWDATFTRIAGVDGAQIDLDEFRK